MKITRTTLLALAASCVFPFTAMASNDQDDWSLGPVGGTFRTAPGTSMLLVQSMPAGTPGATSGLLVGDTIVGAFALPFGVMDPNPTTGGYKGPVQDLADAMDRAEANGGSLPLSVLRPNVGLMSVTVSLPSVGAFGPAYPRGSSKYDAMYQEACAQIHAKATASSDGNFGANTGWMGLALLSHPNWADTSGAKPYRNSLNKMRDRCIAYINGRILSPVEDSDPVYVSPGLENWELGADVMYLAEYVNKTGDTSTTVMDALQRGVDCLENRIQTSGTYHGHMGHGGVVGDYGDWALNIINVHAHAAFAMAKRAGISIDQSKWDLSWNNCLKGATARSTGNMEDGYVDYGPPAWGQGNGYDAAGRTAGSVFGFYNFGQTPTADDTDALNRMSGYLSRNYHRMQHTHAYTVGGVCFNQLALPYLADRDQRYFMDNVKYFYQFHRTTGTALKYFGGRMNNGGDSDGGYLGYDNVKLYNVAMAGAVANGGLPSIPAANQQRIYAHMKSPWTKWPSITARTASLTGLSHSLDVDVCDWQGAAIAPGNYTASWSKVSGPGTVTFGSASAAATTVNFSAPGSYRLQLTATQNSYTVNELYDFSVSTVAAPSGYTLGSASREIYTGISGNNVASLTAASKFPDLPDVMSSATALDFSSYGDNYGQAVRGFIVPPVTGSYTFYVASDDASQLRFNSSGSSAAGASVICQATSATTQYNWTATAGQTSASYTLTAGQPYYFELLHKEGSGADFVAVAWTGPGISTPTVIAGDALARDNSATILKQPVSRSGNPGGSATFTTSIRGAGPFLYEWKLDGVAYWGVSTTPTLTLPNIGLGSAGAYTCSITHPGGTLTTAAAQLTLNGSVNVVAGGLKREVWTDLSGSTVASLTSNARYPRFPDVTSTVAEAEGPNGYADNYGQRLSGWVVAPTTGAYVFYIASDDASELWLSTTSSAANLVKIAQITGYTGYRQYSSGVSSTVNLVAGQKYFIQALQKEGGGGDHLSIAWRKPGDAVPANGSAPIPGLYLESEVFAVDEAFNGLVSHWKLDEATGAIAGDALSTGNDGTVNGPTWTSGKRNGALLFDSTDQVPCGNSGSLDGLTAFTASAWVKVNAGSTSEGVIIQQRAPNGWNGQYQLKVSTTGKLALWVYGDSAEQFNLVGATSINDGQWHHVTGGRDNTGNGFVYVDGVLDASVTGTTVRNLSGSISIGIGADIRDNNRHFRGSLDDVRVYNRLLSQAEVAAVRNRAPVFSADPLVVADATEDLAYGGNLANSATDADASEILTFSKISGPAWLSIASNGVLSGTPSNAEVGSNDFVVRVTDGSGAFDEASLTIPVQNVNDAPVFAQNPIALGSTNEDQLWSNSVASQASDVDLGETLVFSKINGASWMNVAANGTISGTPSNAHVGLNQCTVRVTDQSGAYSDTVVTVTVINVNDAPVFAANPINAAQATEDSSYAGSIAASASDVDAGDVLTFSKVGGSSWLSVAANGALSGTPSNVDVGTNNFQVRVTDAAGLSVDASLVIVVANVNDAPTFAVSSIAKPNANQDVAYSGQTLAGSASDVDAGDTLSYSVVSGPTWLVVAANGALSGTPTSANVGVNNWTVRATDGSGAMAQATLSITVIGGLPLPWLTGDIGATGLTGNATHAGGVFTVSGAGAIGSTSDKERYLYQTLSGDGSIVARVSTLGSGGGSSARVGIQIRDTLASNSKALTLAVNSSGAYKWMRRTATGGNTSNTNSGSATAPNLWVRLTRVGNVITASKSTNGTSWTTVGSVTVTLASNCYIGVTVGSGSTTLLNTTQFSNITVVP